ncbi:Kinesin-related protein 11 [Tetrabaena socialis]|uniref:Kinesin-related protein 11 n=1 Tax=Tetrabaena socialis TaxID=47790 RepID=A0A2J7ZYE0_9CHLO|nr:Kinesin-related protein 11 [Tetrabaena socialis]|eukprot:PNH05289.1 Kinesin-related protein 11 [Tetrabaena socialis]
MLAQARAAERDRDELRERSRRASGSSSNSFGLPPAAPPPTAGTGVATRPSISLPRADASVRNSFSGQRTPYSRPPTPTSATAAGAAASSILAGISALHEQRAPPMRLPGESAGGADAGSASSGGSSRSSIQVAVRLRPLWWVSDKERQRGERMAWATDPGGNVGLLDPATGAFTPKHRFDTVFGPDSDNCTVAATLALPLVAPALLGVNGTIFAYGVTSSGKTHTMTGSDEDPGIVPRVIRELFAQMASGSGGAQGRSFSVRLSIMEIYNEVLNDLLDPGRTNLKVREDARSGLVAVEGLAEQPVARASQALELIARGDENRKVSATAFNEDSSRSHTITRIVVESVPSPSSRSAGAAEPSGSRTVACLSLIDLAGSESARAVVNKGQRMEGSFINRSLLTLGTVIHKLASTAVGHVPFRDSKLTRLLQPSLSGPGARVAVVCNVTPAMAQSDETANTLKFAARAKLVQVTARTNEILDERTMLRRYQKEVADLKRELLEARRALAAAGISVPGGSAGGHDGAPGGWADDGGGFGALGGSVAAEEAVAAAIQKERDGRQVAEMEATMLRIRLARLQAFVEERGVNVDDLLLATPGGEATSGQLRQPLRPGSGDCSPGAWLRASWSSEQQHSGVRHVASTSRLAGNSSDARDARSSDGGAAAAGPRNPYSSAAELCGGVDAAAAGGDPGSGSPWTTWRAEAPGGAELRAQVEAALSAGGLVSGGASAAAGASGSASVTTRGSEAGADDDLNDGLMAQIRDMISDARLASNPGPPPPEASRQQPQQHFPQRSKLPNGLTGAAPGSSNGAAPSNARTPPLPGRIPSSTMLHPSGPASSTTASQPGHAGAGGVAGSVRFPTRQASSSSLLRSTTPSPTSSYGGGLDLDLDLELQVLNADREVLHDQLVASETANERLTAQVADLRQKVAGYESLTRQAASELAEIRQLKDAFQARLQRETDALRAQLLQAGIAPAAAPHQQQQRHAAHPGDAPLAPSHAEAAAAAASRAPQATPSGLMQPQQQPQHKLSQHQQQQQRYGVQSMAAFGSPAMVGPAPASAAVGAAATPTRAAGPRQRPSGIPIAPTALQQEALSDLRASSESDAFAACRTPSLQAMPSFGASFAAGGGSPAAAGGPEGGPPLHGAAPAEAATAASRLEYMEATVRNLMKDRERATRVEAERTQLLALLQQHGIPWAPGGAQQR